MKYTNTTDTDTNNPHYFEEEEEDTASDSEETLSLCDLSFTEESQSDLILLRPNSPPEEEEEEEEEDSFQFSTNPNPSTISPVDSLLFCGKSIPYNKPSNLQYTEQQQHEKSRISLFRSNSFNRFSSFRHDCVKSEIFMDDYYGRSSSLRFANKSESSKAAAIGNCRNVSGCSRKYKAMIGLTKFPAKMELNEIRRRQSRLAPVRMFPAAGNSNGNGGGEAVVGGGRSLWELARPLRSRSHLLSALARTRTSLSCVPRM